MFDTSSLSLPEIGVPTICTDIYRGQHCVIKCRNGWYFSGTRSCTVRAPPGRLSGLSVFSIESQFRTGLLYGRAGSLTALFGGFRPGQYLGYRPKRPGQGQKKAKKAAKKKKKTAKVEGVETETGKAEAEGVETETGKDNKEKTNTEKEEAAAAADPGPSGLAA